MGGINTETKGPVLTLSTTPLTARGHGEGFASESAVLGRLLGLSALGAQRNRVPPGKKAWPFHCYHENDEFFVILEGRGALRYGADTYAVAAGDVIGCPAGGPETAHQLINAGETDLVYICVSSMRTPEVTAYPDSGTFGVLAGRAALGADAATFAFFGRSDGGAADYWDGES